MPVPRAPHAHERTVFSGEKAERRHPHAHSPRGSPLWTARPTCQPAALSRHPRSQQLRPHEARVPAVRAGVSLSLPQESILVLGEWTPKLTFPGAIECARLRKEGLCRGSHQVRSH